MRWNFDKTKSLWPRKLLSNTVNFCKSYRWKMASFWPFFSAWRKVNKIVRFHKTNNISWNFSSITLGFHEVSKYFVDFRFCFGYFRKLTPKFWFCMYRLKILKFQTWWWWKFKKSISLLPTLKLNGNQLTVSAARWQHWS